MENEILNTLETIRGYVFIIMCSILVWVIFKVAESSQRIFIGFRKAWNEQFEGRVTKLLEIGNYEEAIAECIEKLDKYPNHIDAIWFIARAYYYTEKNVLSQEYFEKAIKLVPSWEDSAKDYLEKLNAR